MRNITLLFLTILLSFSTFSQTFIKEIADSNGDLRELKIKLPRNYEKNTTKSYPVIIVLNGEYLFEPVSGIVDYYSYWDEMPEAIVIGVKQNKTKSKDFLLEETSWIPHGEGDVFMNFLTFELFNFIDDTFRSIAHRTIIGHGKSANFINFYLLQNKPFFNSYIALSPEVSEKMESYMIDRLTKTDLKSTVFYSLITSDNDRPQFKDKTLKLDEALKKLAPENFFYNFEKLENKSHYQIIVNGISNSFENIYDIYKPIDRKEYKEVMLNYEEGNAYDYLVNKYRTTKKLFNMELRVRLNDFNAAEAAIRKKEDWDALDYLSKLASKEYPNTMLGLYYKALFYENTYEPKKAMKTYMSAYTMPAIGNLTADDMQKKIQEIKDDYGY